MGMSSKWQTLERSKGYPFFRLFQPLIVDFGNSALLGRAWREVGWSWRWDAHNNRPSQVHLVLDIYLIIKCRCKRRVHLLKMETSLDADFLLSRVSPYGIINKNLSNPWKAPRPSRPPESCGCCPLPKIEQSPVNSFHNRPLASEEFIIFSKSRISLVNHKDPKLQCTTTHCLLGHF